MSAPRALLLFVLGSTSVAAWSVPRAASPQLRRFVTPRWVARDPDASSPPLRVEAPGDAEDDFEDDDDVLPVLARCPDTNRVVECYVDYPVEVGDTTYTVLHPCDEVVALVGFDPDSGAPELIDPDSKLMDELFPVAAALFEEDDVELMRTASVLTMQGWDEDEDDEGGEYDDDAGFDDDEDDDEAAADGGGDQVEVLSEFEIEQVPYALVRVMEPVYFIAKPSVGAKGEFVLLEAAEGLRVSAAVEQTIVARGLTGRLGVGGL